MTETIKQLSLNGCCVTPSILAKIATILEQNGSLLITNAAMDNIPGVGAFSFGLRYAAFEQWESTQRDQIGENL